MNGFHALDKYGIVEEERVCTLLYIELNFRLVKFEVPVKGILGDHLQERVRRKREK